MVEKFQIDGMLDWGVKTFKKIGLIHSTTGYGNFAAKEIVEGIKARGGNLVAVEAVAPERLGSNTADAEDERIWRRACARLP